MKTRLITAVVIAGAAMAASQSALGQSGICPSTGNPPVPATAPCNLPPPNPGLNIPDPGNINPDTWAYGPNTNLTEAQQNAQHWNPVKARILAGLPFMGKRVSSAGTGAGSSYCSAAVYSQADNHFTWVDLIHSGLGYSQVWPMFVNTACPGMNFTTTAARGVNLFLDERDGQHSSDGGAIIFIYPVHSVADAEEAAFWTYFPPVGHHSVGSNQLGQVYTGNTVSPDGPGQISVAAAGGQRNSVNRNIVLIAQIGGVESAQQAAGIAALDLIHALYLDEADLASKAAGVADYNTLANGVRAAAQASDKYLCTVDRTVTPHTMTCAKP